MGSGASSLCCQHMRKRVYSESYGSKVIDGQLQKEAKMKRKVVKMLLLGASDSGKSTIVKQMRILHSNGFSSEEMRHYRYTIYSNCLDSASHIARAIYKQQIEVPLQEERELIARLAQSYGGQLLNLVKFEDGGKGLVELMAIFFAFNSVKNACQRLTDLKVPDNTYYILEHAERMLTPEYEPTKEDIVHARASTRGIYEINFSFKNFTIRLIDVGGQKTERRKWIHCFEGVDAILFIVSLACYNQVLEEDTTTNQMYDSIDLFTTVYRNKFLRTSFFVMFFNKKDLFRKKLQFVPLQKYFLSFGEKLQSNMDEKEVCNEALKFIRQKFLEVKGEDSRQIYSHVTNATDAKNIDFVFNATCDIVISNNMKNAGLN